MTSVVTLLGTGVKSSSFGEYSKVFFVSISDPAREGSFFF